MGPSSASTSATARAQSSKEPTLPLTTMTPSSRARGLGGLRIAGIAGGDGHAVFLQPLNDRLADAAGSTRDESHSSHVRSCFPDGPV